MTSITAVKNLRLKFPGESEMLFKDLSLSFNRGEKVLLLGTSGCGKSTLLQVLSGLVPRTIDIPMKCDEIQIPDQWGFVFQDPETQFCMPYVDEELAFVLENLEIPREEMRGKIRSLLKEVGLELDNIHTPIQHLSGGMKQRLAIASVLALKPDVIFLDEPTAFIDEKGTEQIWETVKRIWKDKTLIIVEHKIEKILDFADRLIVFTPDGEILADGNTSMVFTHYKEKIKEYGIWYPGAWDEYKRTPNVNNKKELLVTMKLQKFKGYRNREVKIVADHLEVHSGEWVTIMGENGAGKSSLLLAMMQLIKTSGDYFINDIPIQKTKDIFGLVYLVFQNPEYQFLTHSVYDEITYGLQNKKDIESNVKEILSSLELISKKDQHPYQLSVGQKRRLSVATAFLQKPNILLLDEPTFGQDSLNTFKILEWIEQERQKGTIILMVTHDHHITERFATRLWKVQNGKIVIDHQLDRGVKVQKEILHEFII
ncbi:ATP-binding cassette domain-containing protein [Fictibacillus nanhaiensis]|uniref:ABC transporter ATP-binding protein n=1 Tax=Fictibacillus nanhaiensis TaxID=742169 RepID=UPI002E1B7AE6|nr:ATP-binding cassette domain-containing protein [Fictibacillus nanhaiensis]MED1864518.1 ATP-binding cassette domain-containing protein [Fictibacillus nanhaiensis]